MELREALNSTLLMEKLLDGFIKHGIEIDLDKVSEGETDNIGMGDWFVVIRQWFMENDIEASIMDDKIFEIIKEGIYTIAAFRLMERDGKVERISDTEWQLTQNGKDEVDAIFSTFK